jgi:Nucleotide modification associated domain 1
MEENQVSDEMLDFVESVSKLIKECGSLLVSKQIDYGPYNISRAPGGPLNGLRVRIFDKVSRINNLIDSGATPQHESLRDSFLDLANYGIIGLMVLDGEWPE